jgi:Pro-kumamolisin, activation domain/Bacterial Ig-like domain (group 3)/Subtilase family
MRDVASITAGRRVAKQLLFCLTLIVLSTATFRGETPAGRIKGEIADSPRVKLPGSRPPLTKALKDAGRLSPETKLEGMSLVYRRSQTQEAKLRQLLSVQQDPTSNQYHRWLTPEQFGSRFGMPDADITKAKAWLEQEGFTVQGVSRGKTRVVFSGNSGQVENTFGTEIHLYTKSSRTEFAPSSDISLPSALTTVVQSVSNLSSFRPKAHVKFKVPGPETSARFTSSQSGSHFLTPGDIAVIYDVNAAYNSGYTGTGQSIAVVGQSSVTLTDIENFQSAAGLKKKDPTPVLVPNSGTSTTVSQDQAESDLDLEYSSGIAKDATVYFVYVGNNQNYSVYDALQYAVDDHISPIISMSYGTCETELSSSDYTTLNSILQQAASQGQTVVAASGDSGSTDCYGVSGLTSSQQQALAVDFPASSEYVTGLGGSEFSSSDVSSSNTTYWSSASGSDVITSAKSYIPEGAWNDDSSSAGLSSGGGGTSSLTSRPTWQAGVAGISSGSYRLVPDVSIASSPNNAGYLYCSSDSSTQITGSCSNGFRDSSNSYLTVAGGTSFAAPIFAGMLALVNQRLNSTGQGVINSTLYSLAGNASDYASVFHDITSGGNQCTAGNSYCSGSSTSSYAAGTGYDQATGLGSIDLYNLLTTWSVGNASSRQASQTTLSADTTTPASGVTDIITIKVSSGSTSATATPTGTITLTVDGTTQSSTLTLTNGSVTYSFSSTTSGSHVIVADYAGDSSYAASTGSLTLTIGSATSTGSGTFTVTAGSLTISSGNSGTSTVTVTPKNGYTGTVTWTVSADSSLSNACYSLPNATVSSTSAATTTLTVYTSSSGCSSSAIAGSGGRLHSLGGEPTGQSDNSPLQSTGILHVSLVSAMFLIGGLSRRRHASLRLLLLGVLSVMPLVFSGCGNSSSSSASANATKGTYTLTITGTDSSNTSITASTTTTLVIQ